MFSIKISLIDKSLHKPFATKIVKNSININAKITINKIFLTKNMI